MKFFMTGQEKMTAW